MPKPLTKCECGNKEFNLMESYAYKMQIEDDGSLCSTSHADGGVDSITCTECGKDYLDTDFKEIVF